MLNNDTTGVLYTYVNSAGWASVDFYYSVATTAEDGKYAINYVLYEGPNTEWATDLEIVSLYVTEDNSAVGVSCNFLSDGSTLVEVVDKTVSIA